MLEANLTIVITDHAEIKILLCLKNEIGLKQSHQLRTAQQFPIPCIVIPDSSSWLCAGGAGGRLQR